MRVAIVTTSWPKPRGAPGDASGHFVAAEARAMAQRGDEVTVIAAEGAAFGWPGVAANVRARPWRVISAAKWVVQARGRVAAARADRLVAHWAVPCAWPIATGFRGEIEVVSHGGDVRLLTKMPAPLASIVTRNIATRASAWRFVSWGLFDDLVRHVDASSARAVERIACMKACAIEVEANGPAIAQKRATMGEPFAVCVARLVATKRVNVAIDHAAARGMRLVVVGDGPERAKLEAHAKQRGARVDFVGLVDRGEALAWIGAASEVLHASHVEGASTVVREADALGTRVRGLVERA